MRKTLRHLTIGCMVTLGLSGVGRTASADQPEPLTLAVWVRDTANVPDDVLTGAQTEVTRIFRQAGVETVWRAPSPSSANTDAPRDPLITIAILSYDQVERLHHALTRDGMGVGFALNSSPTTRANLAYVFYHRVKSLTGRVLTETGRLWHVFEDVHPADRRSRIPV